MSVATALLTLCGWFAAIGVGLLFAAIAVLTYKMPRQGT